MPTAIVSSNLKNSAAYATLLNQVKKTLLEGQARIEEARVRIYWETGKHIQTHILKYSDRAEYGAEIFKRLSKDLNVDSSVLQRCVQFVKVYPKLPILGGHREFSWSHYLKLITIPDKKERLLLEKNITQKGWTADELAARLKEEHQKILIPKHSALGTKPLIPLRGAPYTYQVIDRPNIKTGKSSLRLDLGFGVFHKDPALVASFNKGDIVESRPKEDAFKLYKTNRTAKDLYTYWAEIERVIDGDTVKVRFDLGFNVEVRETLRLRGLDCPEMDTKEGQAAKTFVQSHLKEEQFVLVRSSRSDKYDRYLADIFIPQSEEPNPSKDLYLNNLLLQNGYAKRMK